MQSHVFVFFLAVAAASAATASKISPRFSKETHLSIQNLYSEDIINTLVDVDDPDDWEDGDGPQVDFQGVTVPAGQIVDRREEVDYFADSNYFTMTLEFADGTSDVFKANLRAAIGDGGVDLKQYSGDHKITTTTSSKTLTIIVSKK